MRADYAQVYVNGRMIGTLDRRLDQHTLDVHLDPVPRSKSWWT